MLAQQTKIWPKIKGKTSAFKKLTADPRLVNAYSLKYHYMPAARNMNCSRQLWYVSENTWGWKGFLELILSGPPAQAGSPTSGYPASRPGEQLHLADLKSLPRHKEDDLSFLLTWLEANFGIRNRLCKIPPFLRPVFPLLRILSYCHPLEQKFSVYRAWRI